MLAAAPYPSHHFMYNFNNRQHPMHTSSPVSYPSQLDSLDYTNNWSESGGQGRYAPNGFSNDLKTVNHNQTNVFPSSSQGASSRGQSYYSSERSTYGWSSPSSLSPHSPQSIHTTSLPSTGNSGQLYQGSFRQGVDLGHHTSQEWNQWPENSNPNVMGSLRSTSGTSSVTQWSNDGLRVGTFSTTPGLDMFTSATNSPAYTVSAELPAIQPPTHGYEMSPISSPSPSPSASSRKASPKHSVSPPSSRRPSLDSSTSGSGKKCSHCNATSTPLWRREPTTLKPLCNACGLYLQQRHRHRPKELIDADQDDDESEEEDQNYNGPECSHCHTHRTSVWRRSKTGAQLCNACGVYVRLRGKDRPLSLKRKKIKPRTKHASTSIARSP